jgi:hypothetical protein
MDVSKILAEIDAEIVRLQQARTTIAGLAGTSLVIKPRRGRPKGSVNAVKTVKAVKPAKRKRNLTPEGRKRIADAMKLRWAERRKEVAKKESSRGAAKKDSSK